LAPSLLHIFSFGLQQVPRPNPNPPNLNPLTHSLRRRPLASSPHAADHPPSPARRHLSPSSSCTPTA
uniref:Uncharacterized protein n=1 Tax=Aegilops tauschii subsp. strangulata TaxID=200361 RepID=A0A453MFU8_AEGTS